MSAKELEKMIDRIDEQIDEAMSRVDELERQRKETRRAWIAARKAEGLPDFAA